MTPEEARALIEKQFVDGTLSSAEKDSLDRYLTEHPEMNATYDRYANLEVALADDLAPAALQERIMARVTEAAAKAEPAQAPIDLAAERRRRMPIVAIGGAIAAVAAAILLFVAIPSNPPLPEYEMALFRGAQRERSTAVNAEVPRFGPNTRFEVQIAPMGAVAGTLEARGAFLRDGERVALPLSWERSLEGAFMLRGFKGEDLGLGEGQWDVVIAVGRREDLPSLEKISSARSSDRVRVLRARIIYDTQ